MTVRLVDDDAPVIFRCECGFAALAASALSAAEAMEQHVRWDRFKAAEHAAVERAFPSEVAS